MLVHMGGMYLIRLNISTFGHTFWVSFLPCSLNVENSGLSKPWTYFLYSQKFEIYSEMSLVETLLKIFYFMWMNGLPRCISVHDAFTCKFKVGTEIEKDPESLELEL